MSATNWIGTVLSVVAIAAGRMLFDGADAAHRTAVAQ